MPFGSSGSEGHVSKAIKRTRAINNEHTAATTGGGTPQLHVANAPLAVPAAPAPGLPATAASSAVAPAAAAPIPTPAAAVIAPAAVPLNPGEAAAGIVPAVDFQELARRNELTGAKDEVTRLTQMTEELQVALKTQGEQLLMLQGHLGTVEAENKTLREENESKQCDKSILGCFTTDSFGQNDVMDLNTVPPVESAIEGALTILTAMFARPIEFTDQTASLDLFENRPRTSFSENIQKLQSLGLDRSNPEHSFFLSCYMSYHVAPDFCKEGILPEFSGIVSFGPGGSQTPRHSVLKKLPRKFRKIFLSQKNSETCTSTSNSSLRLQPGGGLCSYDRLPKDLHILFAKFAYSGVFKNPTVPLISQFITFLQNGLTDLDKILLTYESPVYKACPLRKKTYKNGKVEILKNTQHPIFEKWDSLMKPVHFDVAYSTTRITFPWKGFYMPKGKISSTRDKYAFFAFVYSTDLFLGPLPLWPMEASSSFQLDRKDPMRHYTVDNTRWLSKSDNMASKPSTGGKPSSDFTKKKDVVRLLHSCERSQLVFTEMLGALVKGYGSSNLEAP